MGLAVLPTNLAVLHPALVLVRALPSLGPRAAWLVMHRDARRVARVRLVADRAAEAVRKALA